MAKSDNHSVDAGGRGDQNSFGRSTDNEQLDTTVDVVTPENIAFKYNVAGPFRRLCAFLADSAIIVGSLVVLAMLFWAIASGFDLLFGRLFGDTPAKERAMSIVTAVLYAIYFIVWFSSYWSFGALFETYWNGQTPGKRMMGIRVLTSNGHPIAGWQAVLRNLLRAADSFPLLSPAIFAGTFIGNIIDGIISGGGESVGLEQLPHSIPTFMVGLTFMMMNRRFLRVGDVVSGTMVVIEERSWLVGVARVEDPRTPDLAALLPPGFQVSRSLARAVATYVERRRFFSVPRRREIARHLGEPLLSQLGMPHDTSHDLLLCAIYYHIFVTDGADEVERKPAPPPVEAPAPVVTPQTMPESGVMFVGEDQAAPTHNPSVTPHTPV